MKAKTHLFQTKSRGGFTLVEMLVVIGMIAALAGISFPVYNNIKKKVERMEYEAGFNSIERALNNFQTEYNYYPSGIGVEQWDGEYLSTEADMTRFITVLAGAEADAGIATPINFKGIAFLDKTPQAKLKGGVYTSGFNTNADGTVSYHLPWGDQFKAMLVDTDFNEEFRMPYVKTTNKLPGKQVLIWGWGEDDTWRTDDDWGNFEFPGMPWEN